MSLIRYSCRAFASRTLRLDSDCAIVTALSFSPACCSALRAASRTASAVAAYEKSLALDPTNKNAVRWLEKLKKSPG